MADDQEQPTAVEAPEPAGQADPEPHTGPAEPHPAQTLAGLILLLALIAGVVWLISQLAPGKVRESKNPDFVDNIFASPIVIAAARILLLSFAVVLLFGGLYIVASVVVRMGRREWLRRAGWFESQVSEEVAEGLDQADWVFDSWLEALQENEELGERLAERDQTIQYLLEQRDELVQELERQPGA